MESIRQETRYTRLIKDHSIVVEGEDDEGASGLARVSTDVLSVLSMLRYTTTGVDERKEIFARCATNVGERTYLTVRGRKACHVAVDS